MFFDGSDVGIGTKEDVFELGLFLVGFLDGFSGGQDNVGIVA